MKKTNQVRINDNELFLLSAAVKMFSKDESLCKAWGFSKEEVELLHTKLVRESVIRRN